MLKKRNNVLQFATTSINIYYVADDPPTLFCCLLMSLSEDSEENEGARLWLSRTTE